MLKRIQAHYRGIRISNASIIAFAAVSLAIGILFLIFFKSPLLLGAALALLPLASAQFFICAYRFWRSFKEYDLSKNLFAKSPSDLLANDKPQLSRRNLKIDKRRKFMSIGFVIFFFLCLYAVFGDRNAFLLGSSVVLLVQAAIMLIYEVIIQYHTREYLYQLEKLEKDL